MTTLAESAQVTKQTAQFLVDQVERSGCIEQEWHDHLGGRAYAALFASLSRLREITDPYR
ncbi:MAG: hypothetical protein U0R80_09315 [Nocardioidaceae bacterium]